MSKIKILNTPKGKKDIGVNKTIKPVTKGSPFNMEAEKGEVIVGDFSDLGFPELYVVGGERHYNNGTNLNAPENSFVFSRDKSMNIKNEDILSSFGKKPKKSGYDPAEIAKQYDINEYLGALVDPDVDKLQKETAEDMIKNYNEKLGKLALTQESMKGFDNGIPFIATPYLESMGIDVASLVNGTGKNQPEVPTVDEEDTSQMKKGGEMKIKILKIPKYQKGGPTVKSTLLKKQKNEELMQNMMNQNDSILAAKQNAYQQQNTNDYQQYLLDSQKQSEMQNLIKQYAKAKQLQMTGQQSSPWDFLPWVTSAEEEQSDFEDLAHQYGQNPDVLANMFEGNTKTPIIKPAQKKLNSKWEGKTPGVDYAVYKNDTLSINRKLGGGAPEYGDGGSIKSIGGGKYKYIKNGKAVEGILDKNGQFIPTEKNQTVKRKNDFVEVDNSRVSKRVGAVQNMPTYTQTQLNNMEKAKSMGYELNIPTVLGDESGIAKTQQKLPNNVFGDQNWASAELFPDFRNRVAWYFDKHPEFDPRKKEDVLDFQKSYNHRLVSIGFEPELQEDGLFGGRTYRAYDLNKHPEIPQAESKNRNIQVQQRLQKSTLDSTQPEQNNPFWTQDVINTLGTTGDFLSIKKYMPWQAGYQTQLPTPTFYDPTRELAANSEQANIAENALGAFAGPQALSGRLSSVQGSALESAANILGKYNNLNVGVANQFAVNNANISNADSQNRANQATNLYDKTVITNQQFDNAKNMARQNMRQSVIQAFTNRGQTQALNTVNNQYRVDPTTGFVQHTGVPGKTDPAGQVRTIEDTFNNLMTNPNLRSNPDLAYKIALKSVGAPDDNDFMQNYLRDYNQTLPK